MEEREEAGGEDGTAAVLYGIFTSFTQSLAGLEERLAAIEAAVRDGQAALLERLEAVETAMGAHPAAAVPAPTWGDGLDALGSHLDGRADVVDRRMASLEEAVASVRSLLQEHADETAHSLGRRATDAGRRLASDLGLRPRRGRTEGDG